MLIATSGCSTVLRRFAGPLADEVAIGCRPGGGSASTTEQAYAVYRGIAEVLAAQQAGFRNLTSETLFLRDIRGDLPLVLDARRRVLEEIGQSHTAPPPAFIEQAPVDSEAAFAWTASAIAPKDEGAWSVRDVATEASCQCDGCVRSAGRLVRLGEQASLHTSLLYGTGSGVRDQARQMFRAAERMLVRCGMGFGDVTRTWIYLRNIDRDYDAFNAARREFFAACGLTLRPASTGVGGVPLPQEHACALSLQAIKSSPTAPATGMSTPSLNEAWSYGADFSRGLRVVEANRVALHVSGTASIDETGRSIHAGDFAAQAERMLDNIESLLAGQGAGFAQLLSAVTYLKRPADAPALRALYQHRGFAGFPCPVVRADLCRPELLCETEALAVLPRDAVEA